MRRKIISNIFASMIEKFFIIGTQLIASILLIRLLPREDFGIVGVVAGYFVFIHILNISLESIILRDHKKYDNQIEKYLYNFFIFNMFKAALFLCLAVGLTVLLVDQFQNGDFIYSIFSITLIYIADSIIAPFVIYSSTKFNQKLVTKLSVIRALFNIVLLLGLFLYPTLQYVFIKDLIVTVSFVSLWIYTASKFIDYKKISYIEDIDMAFLKTTMFSYSLWTHLNGVVTNIIYRSDTFFLSFFISLVAIGNYNIALTSANVANIMPMILGYQNSVAISNAKDREHVFKISNAFLKLSAFAGLMTFLGFYFLGNLYLYIMTGVKDNSEIFYYMMYIVSGLVIVKSFASPLVSYINVYGSVKELVMRVSLPILIITAIVYPAMTFIKGANGIAQANVLVSICWVILVIYQTHRDGFRFGFHKVLRYDRKNK